MANITSVVKKCCNCGCESSFDLFIDDTEYGPRDLDFRPAPTKRAEIDFVIERCPKCNYVSKDIEKPIDFDASLLKSDAYLDILNANYPYVARSYMLASLIEEDKGNFKEAGLYMLSACWVLDDNDIEAIEEREKVAILLSKADLDDLTKVILVDVYRRAELFDEAKEYIDKLVLSSDYEKIIEIEKNLIEEYDSELHNLSEFNTLSYGNKGDTTLVPGCDSIDTISEKLFGDGSEAIIMPFDGMAISFDLIATLEVSNRWFSILHSELQKEDEAYVYELFINEDGTLDSLSPLEDEETIDLVFSEYYKLVE